MHANQVRVVAQTGVSKWFLLAFLNLEQVFSPFWLHLSPTLTSLIINIAFHLQLPPPFTEFLLQNKNKFISSLGSNHESKHYWKIKILLCHVSIQNLKNKKIKKYIQWKQWRLTQQTVTCSILLKVLHSSSTNTRYEIKK